MNPARRRALEALKRQRPTAPAPLFEEPQDEAEAEIGIDRVAVLFPLPLPEPFDYRASSSLNLQPGQHVIAPIGTRLWRGVVWRVERGSAAAANLKAIEEVLPGAAIPDISRSFLDWAAKYLVTSPGNLIGMIARSPEALLPAPTYAVYRAAAEPPARMTDARARVLRIAAEEALPPGELARRAEVSSGVVRALIDSGALIREERSEDPPFDPPRLPSPPWGGSAARGGAGEGGDPLDAALNALRERDSSEYEAAAERPPPPASSPQGGGDRLSPEQRAAAEALIEAINAGGYSTTLLDGVTGSGKTEVYLEAVAAALARDPNAQVLVLLPEIALTQAVMTRFTARFGVPPVEWHSGISHKARRRAWREIAEGRARLIIGARSALFLPYPQLALIVVDEEHDPSYKQDDGVAYHARDLAVVRAKLGSCALVLATATPSLETLINAQSGKYGHVMLRARHGAAILPDVELLDMRLDPPEKGNWLSPKLVRAMEESFMRQEQSLLYINRRGYAPLTLCKACGHKMQSPETESWLVEHRYSGRLVCHLTGFSMPKPKDCPKCGAPDPFVAIGPGVERVEEEVRGLFPEARVEIFSSDTAPNGESVREIVGRMERGEIDILIGTQIVAKGHNFPHLTLVGVVDADAGLKGGDLRAGERTFQLVSQVAGRAGRAERKGRALIQTYAPDEEVMRALAAGDRDGFLAAEAAQREMMGMPPYGRLCAVILSAPDEAVANQSANTLGEKAPSADGVDVWGPAPAPLSVIRGRHRRRFLVRADRGVDLSAFMAAWMSRVKLPSSVRVQVDIDPYSFL